MRGVSSHEAGKILLTDLIFFKLKYFPTKKVPIKSMYKLVQGVFVDVANDK